MSKFSPTMTKQELVDAFAQNSPDLAYMSTESAYQTIVNKFPQYELNEEVKPYEPVNVNKKNLFDSLPSQIRKGYNDSLQGMAHKMMYGKDRFDVSDYEQGVLNDLGAGIASFFMPVDFLTTVAGGGVGGAASKALVKKVVYKKLIRNGALKQKAGKAAIKASEFAAKSGTGAGAIGLYSGADEALRQKLTDGSIDMNKVVKSGAKGTVLGFLSGGVNVHLTKKGAGLLTKTGAEMGTIGLGAPILEGEMPTPQDFLQAGALVTGLKGVNLVYTKGAKKLKQFKDDVTKPEYVQEFIPKDAPGRGELYKDIASVKAKADVSQKATETVYTNKRGDKGVITKSGDDTIQFKTFDGKVKAYKSQYFWDRFKSKDKKQLNPQETRASRVDEIRKLEKQLKHKGKIKETFRAMELLGSDTKKAIRLSSLNNQSLVKLRDRLALEFKTKQHLANLEKVGVRVAKTRASLFMDKLLPDKINQYFDVIRPAKNQGSVSQFRRAYIALADDYLTTNRQLVAQTHDLMQRGGFGSSKPTKDQVQALANALKISEKEASDTYWTSITKAVEQGIDIPHAKNVREIMDMHFNTAKNAGVNVSGYISNYIPKILKKGVADDIFADIQGLAHVIYGKAKKSKKIQSLDDEFSSNYSTYQDVVDMLLQAQNNYKGFISKRDAKEVEFLDSIIKIAYDRKKFKSKWTNSGMKSLLEEGGELGYLRAIGQLGREASGELFRQYGNIEKKRKVKFSNDFYERDIRALLGTYSLNVSKRTAQVRAFGDKSQVVDSLLSGVKNDRDREIIRELHAHILGTISTAKEYNYNANVKNFLQKVVEWETATKIGLGTASAMNLSQFTISSALAAGYWRFAKGSYKYVTDKGFRRQVDASGANLYSYVNELMELSPNKSWSRGFVNWITDKSQFNRINSINNILAASSARVYIDDLIAVVSGNRNILNPGQLGSKEWAQKTLIRMGVDPTLIKKGKISNTDMMNALAKFAQDSQLQKDILSDPIIMNRPTWKPFLIFKSFGYRQYQFIKNILTQDALNYNYLPMLRLAAGGYATGAVGLKSKELMKEFFSGEKTYDPSQFLEADGEEIIENIAAIGAFGYLGDILTSLLEEGKSMARALTFLAIPAIASDLNNFFYKFLPSLESDIEKYQGDFIKRLPARVLKLTGAPLLKDLAKNEKLRPLAETAGMKSSRLEFLRGRRKSAIMDSIIDAGEEVDYKKVLRDMYNWNNAYPQYRITLNDISFKNIMKRKLKKWKDRGEV